MLAYLERFDHQLFFALNNGLASPWWDWLFWSISVIGDGTPLTLLTGLVLWRYDRRAWRLHYGWLVLAVVGGNGVVHLLKYSIARPRPLALFAPLLQSGAVYIHTAGKLLFQGSFPSGHAQAAAAVCTYLWCLYPRHRLWWGTILFLVGLSRIYLGVHFPADVLCGTLLGVFLSWGVFSLRYAHLQRSSPSRHL